MIYQQGREDGLYVSGCGDKVWRLPAGDADKQVGKCLGMLGGLKKYVGRGDGVLLKVTLLSPEPPEKAITTCA